MVNLTDKEYHIRRVAGPPGSGGGDHGAWWRGIETAPISLAPWAEFPGVVESEARVCHDGRALYVRLEAREENPLVRFDGLLDPVCRDSCLEFFFSPSGLTKGRQAFRYLNFEFNPLGAMCMGFGTGREDRVRQVLPAWREYFSVAPFVSRELWGVEFTVPAAFIALYFPGFTLEPGRRLRANFYKCGDDTPAPHYLVWNPVTAPRPDFHRPECFGLLVVD